MATEVEARVIETDAAMVRWLTTVQRSKSPHTHVNYSRAMKSVRPFLPDCYQDITWEHLSDWQEARSKQTARGGREVNPNTVDAYLTGIKSWCRWVMEMYDLGHNPSSKIKYLVKDGQRIYDHRVLTHAEFERVVAAAAKMDPLARDAILWFGHTGIRCMEFRKMEWGSFSQDLTTFEVIGKGRKRRVVPCDNAVCQSILAGHKGKPDLPFVSKYSVTKDSMWLLCQKLTRRAQIESFGPHALRHYYVTRMAELGVPIKVISTIIGHASTEITELIYTHLTTQSIMGWSKKLNKAGPQ